MSNLFKYKINLSGDSTIPKSDEEQSLYFIPTLAFALVATIITVVFSTIVMILNYCFPNSLDGTYLKLFF